MTTAALITPFTNTGALDLVSLDRLARHYLQNGAKTLIAFDSLAETTLLSTLEQREILQILRLAADEHGARLTVHVDASTGRALEQAKALADLADELVLDYPKPRPDAIAPDMARKITAAEIQESFEIEVQIAVDTLMPVTAQEVAGLKADLAGQGLIDSDASRADAPRLLRRATRRPAGLSLLNRRRSITTPASC